MRKIFVLFWLILLCNLAQAQEKCTVYPWLIAKNCSPDTILGISFKKHRLDSLPSDLKRFNKLKSLDISHNKLENLPDFLTEFKALEEIDFSKNKFRVFPEQLFKISTLRKISFTRNNIESIPSPISNLKELTYLDFWDNPIASFPEEFTLLPKLKTIHAEGIMFGPKFQKMWVEKLPKTSIYFDEPCDCKE